jgi:transposase-like protein
MRRFTPAQKLLAVRLRLEEGFSLKEVCAEVSVTQSALSRWVSLYRQFGEAGLQPAARSRAASLDQWQDESFRRQQTTWALWEQDRCLPKTSCLIMSAW